MAEYTVTTNPNLRALCIKHNWFTCGDCRQYERLFEANRSGYTLEEIAAIIWICSDDVWSKEGILSILTDARRTYLNS